MSNLYELVFDTESVQSFKIFYDTIFLNCKVEDGGTKNNYVIVEKLNFDYSNNSFDGSNRGTLINFGDTERTDVGKSTGNCFVDFVFDNKNKLCYLIGLSTLEGITHPIVYSFDINSGKCQRQLSFSDDLSSLSGLSFNENQKPFVKIKGTGASVYFSSISGDSNILSNISLRLNKNGCDISNYQMYYFTGDYLFKNSFGDSLVLEHGDKVSIIDVNN